MAERVLRAETGRSRQEAEKARDSAAAEQ